MRKVKEVKVTFYTPGAFVPEEYSEDVPNLEEGLVYAKKEAAKNKLIYAFSFSETEFVVDGEKRYKGDTKPLEGRCLIGTSYSIEELENIPGKYILVRNIKNCEGIAGVKCRTGNWQILSSKDVLITPEELEKLLK